MMEWGSLCSIIFFSNFEKIIIFRLKEMFIKYSTWNIFSVYTFPDRRRHTVKVLMVIRFRFCTQTRDVSPLLISGCRHTFLWRRFLPWNWLSLIYYPLWNRLEICIFSELQSVSQGDYVETLVNVKYRRAKEEGKKCSQTVGIVTH